MNITHKTYKDLQALILHDSPQTPALKTQRLCVIRTADTEKKKSACACMCMSTDTTDFWRCRGEAAFEIVIVSINIERALVILNRRERETGGGGRQELRELENKRQFKGKRRKEERQRERVGGREKRGLEGRRVRTEALCHRCSTLQ